MDIYCDHCGYERRYTGAMSPVGQVCGVCGIGHMREGRQLGGFTVTADHQPVPRNLPLRDYVVTAQGAPQPPGTLLCAAYDDDDPHRDFGLASSIHDGALLSRQVPEPQRFAWLAPYHGEYQRAHFVQLTLARVARAKFVDNQGRLPRLIDPFTGSGQCFLNASYWGPSLNDGLPLFGAVVAGDINPYVCAAFQAMNHHGDTIGLKYHGQADRWDATLAQSHQQLQHDLQHGGKKALDNAATDPGPAYLAAFKYIWLVNRSTVTMVNEHGGVEAQLDPHAAARIADIRIREWSTLNATLDLCRTLTLNIGCQDFRVTCGQAKATDIVFLDCPPAPEAQAHVMAEALALMRGGTTVLLCNVALPAVLQCHAQFFGQTPGIAQPVEMPGGVFPMILLPGSGNPTVSGCLAGIDDAWLRHKAPPPPILDESDISDSEQDSQEEGGEPRDLYPNLLDIVLRPGHINVYRAGLGAADTVAALVIDGCLVPRAGGKDHQTLAGLEARSRRLDRQIKAVNDAARPHLQLAAKLDRDITALGEAEDFDESAEVRLGTEKVAALTDATQDKAERRQLLDARRVIHEQVLWISAASKDEREKPALIARTAQVEALFALLGDGTFGISLELAAGSDTDYMDPEAARNAMDPSEYHPRETAHHSEQRLIVSGHWVTLIAEIIKEAQRLGTLAQAEAELTRRRTTMMLNRSSCVVCNAFLVAELLRLWAKLATVFGCTSAQTRAALSEILVFEVTYSVVYTPSEKHIGTLNGQLKAAGWSVVEHDTTQASQDEVAHERLALGGGAQDTNAPRSGRKRKAAADSDDEWNEAKERPARAKAKPEPKAKPKPKPEPKPEPKKRRFNSSTQK